MDRSMTERRLSPRWTSAEAPWNAARVRPGLDVDVINLCEGGALVEGPARLLPGHRVVIQFGAPGQIVVMAGSVVRCEVVVLERDGGIRYRGAVRFDCPLRVVAERFGG
jgi:hypothetical protein